MKPNLSLESKLQWSLENAISSFPIKWSWDCEGVLFSCLVKAHYFCVFFLYLNNKKALARIKGACQVSRAMLICFSKRDHFLKKSHSFSITWLLYDNFLLFSKNPLSSALVNKRDKRWEEPPLHFVSFWWWHSCLQFSQKCYINISFTWKGNSKGFHLIISGSQSI